MKSCYKVATAMTFVLASASAFTQTAAETANYLQYRESISFPQTYTNNTPHTGAQTQVFYTDAGIDTDGFSREVVTFDSNPAPYISAIAEARAYTPTAYSRSTVRADLSYGFMVSGAPNSFVDLGFRGKYDIYNASYLSKTSLGMNVSFRNGVDIGSGSVGFDLTCDASRSPDIAKCSGPGAFQNNGYSGLNASLEVKFSGGTRGSIPTLAIGTEGTFEGTVRVPLSTFGKSFGLVYLNVDVNAVGTETTYSQMSYAFIDPEFFIDPDYLTLNPSAKVTLTEGVGNQMVTAVPEPETYAMMLAGLGLMGSIARRRKAKLTA